MDDLKMGEVLAKLDMIGGQVQDLSKKLDEKYVPRTELESRLSRLENGWQRWTAVGALIVSAIALAHGYHIS